MAKKYFGGFRVIILFLFILISYSGLGQTGTKWAMISDEDDIKLYRNDTIETIKNFIADFTLPTSLEGAENYITNPMNYKEWINGMEDISMVKFHNDSTQVYQFLLNVKSLFKRAGVLNTARISDQESITYIVELDTTGQYPLEHTSVNFLRLRWELIPEGDDVRVKMNYMGYTKKYNFIISPLVDMFYEMAMQNLVEDLKASI